MLFLQQALVVAHKINSIMWPTVDTILFANAAVLAQLFSQNK